ncbi:spore gernimation protein, partial [Verrucosispora sp. SN26_14.1]
MSRRRHRVAGVTVVLLLLAVGCAPSRSGSLGPAPTGYPAAPTGAVGTGPSTSAAPTPG